MTEVNEPSDANEEQLASEEPESTAAVEPAATEFSDAAVEPRPTRRPYRRRRRRVVIEWVVVLIGALLLALGIRTFVFQAYFIPSASMEPTLNIGDRILVNKAFFNYHDLKEGAIVVFTQPPRDTMCGPSETDLVKRVIGLPGQSLYSIGNIIYVNGEALKEPYLPHTDPLGPAIPGSKAHPFKVPANEYFVMGDNRAISCDSRYWGPITGSSIVGQVVLRWWHNGRPDFHIF